MAQQVGIIAYQSRSYGPNGQPRETYTRHIYTGGAVEGSQTLCGREITQGSTRFKWTHKQEGLDGRPSSQVDCLRCLNVAKLRKLGYRIMPSGDARVFVPIALYNALTRQDAQESPSSVKPPLDAPQPSEVLPVANLPEFDAADGGWAPPSPDELQACLERFLDGYGNEPRLMDSVADIERASSIARLGRFLSPDDWKIVAWAFNAWVIADHLTGQRDYGRDAEELLRQAGNRSMSIWRS